MAEQQQGDEPWNDPTIKHPRSIDDAFDKPPRKEDRVPGMDPNTPKLDGGKVISDQRLTESEERRVSVGGATEGTFLGQWWVDRARAEVEPMIAKAREYGGGGRAIDLIELGRDLHAAGVRIPGYGVDAKDHLSPDARYAELGIYFYIKGKFARWQAAIIEGRPVSDDTLLDIGIYVRMLQRIREVGGWPV